MRILILGGTVFVGRALTDAALQAGHHVTHLHRGKSAPPDARVETLTGDRTVDLEVLEGRTWDAVIDTSGYLPQVVKRSVGALRKKTRRYAFVSSISVYRGDGYGEEAPVAPPPCPVPDAMTPETYGALKAMCEEAVRESFGDDALIVRPGLIVGPHDPTDRFTYWPVRVARGGRILAPGRRDRTLQFIDVRDLARWMIRLLERGTTGTFNATGPARKVTMEEFLDACQPGTGAHPGAGREPATFEWRDDAFLRKHDVAPWKDLPMWIPDSDPKANGFLDVPIARALAAGLGFRPLRDTIVDTVAWSVSRPADREWKAGLTPERERALLAEADLSSSAGTRS
jgi:2'-hydroxyisoflavone reductase